MAKKKFGCSVEEIGFSLNLLGKLLMDPKNGGKNPGQIFVQIFPTIFPVPIPLPQQFGGQWNKTKCGACKDTPNVLQKIDLLQHKRNTFSGTHHGTVFLRQTTTILARASARPCWGLLGQRKEACSQLHGTLGAFTALLHARGKREAALPARWGGTPSPPCGRMGCPLE